MPWRKGVEVEYDGEEGWDRRYRSLTEPVRVGASQTLHRAAKQTTHRNLISDRAEIVSKDSSE